MSPKRSDNFKADRREEILAAAMRCFLARGYDRTTMREIAAEAGVSTGAIYVYFATKAEMLQAVCKEESEVQRANLLAALRTLPPGDDRIEAGLEAALARQLTASPAERQQGEQLNLMMLYEATREPLFAESMRDLFGSWRAVVDAVLAQEQAAGRLRDDVDRRALGEILIALPFGLELLELLGGRELDWAAIVCTLADALRRGTAGTGPAAHDPAPGRNGAAPAPEYHHAESGH